jgi:UDP-glucose 4-epimerase
MRRDDNDAILVTGGNGAIGRFVIDELVGRGVRTVSLSRSGARANLPEGAVSVQGDTREILSLEAVIREQGIGRIIHMAALLLGCENDLHLGFSINALGTVNVLEAARRNGVRRTVFVSTKAAFGPLTGEWGDPGYRPIVEDHPRNPTGMYGLTKSIAEDMAGAYRTRGLDVTIIRFGTSCGPGKGAQHGLSAITSTMVENAVQGLPTVIAQGGTQKDDIIYNRDVAHGIVLAAVAEHAIEPVYHLGSGVLITLEDLAEAIREEIPGAVIRIGPGLDYMGLGMGNYCLMSTLLARRDLGFEPHYPLRAWVKDYIALLRAGAHE